MAGYIGSKSSVTQVDGYTEAEADAEFVNDPNGAITVSGSNVGIGTSSPSYKLDVASTVQIRAGESLRLQNVAGSSAATVQCAGAGSNSDLGFSTAGSERMRLDSSGNLLVGGTTSAGYSPLQVGSTSSSETIFQMLTATNGYNTIHFGDATAGSGRYSGYFQYDHTNDALITGVNGSERMRIDSSGRVTMPYQPSFRATSGASNTVSADVVFTQKDFDISNSYSTSTGRFTAPLTGTYLFYLTALYTTGSTSPTWKVSWYKNGSFDAVVGEYQSTFNTTSSYHTIFNSTITMRLSSGDYVNIKNMTNKGVHISGTQTKFGGYLLG